MAWAIAANHGGGYSYRLCPATPAGDISEACFQRHQLDFDGTTSDILFGNGSRVAVRPFLPSTSHFFPHSPVMHLQQAVAMVFGVGAAFACAQQPEQRDSVISTVGKLTARPPLTRTCCPRTCAQPKCMCTDPAHNYPRGHLPRRVPVGAQPGPGLLPVRRVPDLRGHARPGRRHPPGRPLRCRSHGGPLRGHQRVLRQQVPLGPQQGQGPRRQGGVPRAARRVQGPRVGRPVRGQARRGGPRVPVDHRRLGPWPLPHQRDPKPRAPLGPADQLPRRLRRRPGLQDPGLVPSGHGHLP